MVVWLAHLACDRLWHGRMAVYLHKMTLKDVAPRAMDLVMGDLRCRIAIRPRNAGCLFRAMACRVVRFVLFLVRLARAGWTGRGFDLGERRMAGDRVSLDERTT
jgi:hypothetical protein